jgi:hypothetical protein
VETNAAVQSAVFVMHETDYYISADNDFNISFNCRELCRQLIYAEFYSELSQLYDSGEYENESMDFIQTFC